MMKNLIVSIIVLIACTVSLFAQITQKQADEIVMERLRGETRSYALYADRRVWENTTISTSSGETVELSYPSRVYYIRYADASSGYLVVKESTGNLLEIKAKNDSGPFELSIWEVVLPKEIPFTEYSLGGSGCRWKNFDPDKVITINNDEELNSYIDCTRGNYPRIDFSKHSLLLVRGNADNVIRYLNTGFLQEAVNSYALNVNIHTDAATDLATPWLMSVTTPKINSEAPVMLNAQQITGGENYYVAGYDANSVVSIGDGTGKSGMYVLVSENLNDTLAAGNLPDNLFTFPAEMMPTNLCGFSLFRQKYRFAYKVQITYRRMTWEELQSIDRPCSTLYTTAFYFKPVYVMIESISKME